MTGVLPSPRIGAPGIYYRVPPTPPALEAERMHVCAFVGVAPRGPARWPGPGEPALAQPVAVESWGEYRRLYGGFEGPGLLPYAVAAFFENGGRRAYVVRVVHDYRRLDGTVDSDAIGRLVATARLENLAVATPGGPGEVWLRARSEGRWGNDLTATLGFVVRPLALPRMEPQALLLPLRHELTAGAVIRVTGPGAARELRRVTRLEEEWEGPGRSTRRVRARLDQPIAPPDVRGLELVEGELTIDDGAGRLEHFTALGLSPSHHRWLAAVLTAESELLLPAANPQLPAGDPRATWAEGRELALDPELRPCAAGPFRAPGGQLAGDGYREIDHRDFIAPDWVPGDDAAARGIHALVGLADLSLLAVPDL
ncbi:MAG TPA: hypothetical protein VG500_08605, partial [Gemmatimonadales bacterium]|nr:hypothetical protein [Gemmatimonadales bacterium]